MSLAADPPLVAGILAVIFVGGAVKGLAGFGYALVSTAVLAALIEPSVAVVLMIVPTLAANVDLLGELDREELRSCLLRFWPFVAAAVVGTLVGMASLDAVPTHLLALALGGLTLGYVALRQERVDVPGARWVAARCFRPGTAAEGGLGFVSGFVFGASNVAVQVVAYLDSLELDRSTFVGVLALILVGVSGVRVVAAWGLGLYGDASLLALSAVAAVPGVLGVAAGGRLRRVVDDRAVGVGALVLLAAIGAKLTVDGLAGLGLV